MQKAIRNLLVLAMIGSVAPVYAAEHSSGCPYARANAASASGTIADSPGEGSLFDVSRRSPGLFP